MEYVDPTLFFAASLVLIACAMLLLGAGLLRKHFRQQRHRQGVERALASRDSRLAAALDRELAERSHTQAALKIADDMGVRIGEGRFADSFLPGEDKQLIELCGFADVPQAKARFIAMRVLLMFVLPVIVCVFLDEGMTQFAPVLRYSIGVFFGAAAGYMLPKWVLLRRARRRKKAVEEELPLLIDLLKLLQGVGLSMDQSLHTVIQDFSHVMPVLAGELRFAAELHSRGRSREQSLARMATGFDNDDLSAICKLIAQVDRHGGAVQEPLARFGERVREKRRMGMKEKIGKLTVKMTGVMVLTLLPGLMIITGGAGFLAVIRGLSRVSGG